MSKLFLLPNVLSEEVDLWQHVPARLQEIVVHLDGLVGESEKEARRYLKRFVFPEGRSFRDIPLYTLNEHTKREEISEIVHSMQNKVFGLISDAGLPCIADPGAELIALSRRNQVDIETISGPSSLVFAIQLSGLPCQNFAFHGYLPQDHKERRETILRLEQESKKEKRTQICIEAPYRSMTLLQALIETLGEHTLLSISTRLTTSDEETITLPIALWKKRSLIDLNKKETVFLFRAAIIP